MDIPQHIVNRFGRQVDITPISEKINYSRFRGPKPIQSTFQVVHKLAPPLVRDWKRLFDVADRTWERLGKRRTIAAMSAAGGPSLVGAYMSHRGTLKMSYKVFQEVCPLDY